MLHLTNPNIENGRHDPEGQSHAHAQGLLAEGNDLVIRLHENSVIVLPVRIENDEAP